MLEVYNCGQGDHFRLSFPGCKTERVPLIVDLGPSTFSLPIIDPIIDLLITHSDVDHVCGKVAGSAPKIRNLYIPAYLPELLKIIQKLDPKLFRPLPSSCKTTMLWDQTLRPPCNHIYILNPPISPAHFLGVEQKSTSILNSFLQDFNTSINDLIGPDLDVAAVERPEGYDAEGFITRVISRVIDLSVDITVSGKRWGLRQFVKHDANALSIVFQFSLNGNPNILMTGDADLSVFRRLIARNEPRLVNDILKISHHGSKYGTNKKILKQIMPKVAIISHGNRYGHPAAKVITDIRHLGISDYYTNAFAKTNGLSAARFTGVIPGFPVIML